MAQRFFKDLVFEEEGGWSSSLMKLGELNTWFPLME